MTGDLAGFVAETAARRAACTLPPAAREDAARVVALGLALLFPHFTGRRRATAPEVEAELRELAAAIAGFLEAPGSAGSGRERVVGAVLGRLPGIRAALEADASALLASDPAARSLDEVILAYPGVHALACHRLAHALHAEGVPLLPRLVAEAAHQATGIDIHPAARIGRGVAIDHGTGIVIGETAVIGDRVKLYQGVTLGALSVRKALAQVKRHPTIGDDVVIYAGATILGGDTVVGRGSVIGGNVWLTRSVPPRSVVTVETLERRRPDDDSIEYHI